MAFNNFHISSFGRQWLVDAINDGQNGSGLTWLSSMDAGTGTDDDSALATTWGSDTNLIVSASSDVFKIIGNISNSSVTTAANSNKIVILGGTSNVDNNDHVIAWAYSSTTETIPPYAEQEVLRRYDVAFSVDESADTYHTIASGIYAPLLGCARMDAHNNGTFSAKNLQIGNNETNSSLKFGFLWTNAFNNTVSILYPSGQITLGISGTTACNALNSYVAGGKTLLFIGCNGEAYSTSSYQTGNPASFFITQSHPIAQVNNLFFGLLVEML